MSLNPYSPGSIEVICGPMFSGKSEELIRRINRVLISKQKIQVFKPRIDNRYDQESIGSHDGRLIQAFSIIDSMHMRTLLDPSVPNVAIDEVQFLDGGIVELIDDLANKGVRVLVAGLDQDYKGLPFGVMPSLLARAELVTKLNAVCVQCGAPATRTQRLIRSSDMVLIGAKDKYEARCRHCHDTLEDPQPPLHYYLNNPQSENL